MMAAADRCFGSFSTLRRCFRTTGMALSYQSGRGGLEMKMNRWMDLLGLGGLLILIAYGPGNNRLIIMSTAQGLRRGKAERCMLIIMSTCSTTIEKSTGNQGYC